MEIFFKKNKLINQGRVDTNNEMKFRDLKKLLKKSNLEIVYMEGMNWIPLTLSSNSILVLFFKFIENIFFLKYFYSQSPWLLISVKKINL